jgi:negative regulator of replication initiation
MAPEPEPTRLDDLRARLRETQAAAQRLADEIPAQGWAASASAQARSETAEEIQALAAVLHALRDAVPDDLWDEIREIVRRLLLLLRALLDLVVDRLGAAGDGAPGSPRTGARRGPDLQDIPIA